MAAIQLGLGAAIFVGAGLEAKASLDSQTAIHQEESAANHDTGQLEERRNSQIFAAASFLLLADGEISCAIGIIRRHKAEAN